MNVVFDQYLKSLECTERLPPRDLARYHQELLARLVRHAQDKLPFYRGRLDRLFTSNGEVDLSLWNSVPFLTRDEVIAHGRQLRVANLAADYGDVGEIQTSGSTGTPLQFAVNSMVPLSVTHCLHALHVASASTHPGRWR